MEIPFNYGRIVTGENYTDRIDDVIHLDNNFKALTNTTIISPRRWGKSSMVNKAIETLKETSDEYIFVFLDVFNLKTQEAFLEGYARSVARAFENHSELRQFISEVLPSNIRTEILLGNKNIFPVELRISLEHGNSKEYCPNILDMPQELAERKGKKVIVCIDEFQVITEYDDSLAFQRMLRSTWQRHDKVAYCLFGSKFNMMTDLVGKPRMPLYKFGDMFYLKKISTENWVEFITERFRSTGKSISPDTAGYLANLVENHSYYVQQLAQLTWFRTDDICTKETVDKAFSGLVDQLSMIFIQTVESLTSTQSEFLRALCNGVTRFSSTELVNNYRVGTAANVKNIRKTLEKKEITTSFPNQTEIQDPLFKYWLKNHYFV